MPPYTLLVANRGEIACRIIRSAKELGIRTVAVFSEADRGAAHVRLADEAVLLGPAPAAQSYLSAEALLKAASTSGAQAVHPGYGFLSEDAAFAEQVEQAGLVWVGPTPEQLRLLGAKHTARAAAVAAGVPVFPGTGLLANADQAVAEVAAIGYPVMLKATGGGGGIGMSVCWDEAGLRTGFERVSGLAERSFGDAGVFAERYVQQARHVEVQVFGDGEGTVVSLGDRDCSLQRRHQKVVEEAPAPGLPPALRERLHASARDLLASVNYRSAGTVEFVYDPARGEASFLEVNARLQVEHPVTEAVTGIDLVAWMLRLAGGEKNLLKPFPERSVPVRGHAVEARVYAEDPAAGFRPGAGLLTRVELPEGPDVRVDGWVSTGTRIPTEYDPLLAKLIVRADSRTEAVEALGKALRQSRFDGVEVNLGLLRAVTELPEFLSVAHHTATLDGLGDPEPRITVGRPGLMTTVQDADGRQGFWQIGVPPSGAMDDRSLRAGNRLLGNDDNAAGLECTASGPALTFTHVTRVCVTGAPAAVTVDGQAEPMWTAITVPAGSTLSIGEASAGLRTYVTVAGGFDVPPYLESTATFTLGGFGGHGGRALRPGDVLRTGSSSSSASEFLEPADFGNHWDLTVAVGPHGAPDFFTPEDMQQILSTRYEVHFNSARTGVRLIGPKPVWARRDGGEAGLHPSNIHDNAYSVGALDFTGDTPILLGPDGPSLGGFVCPVTVVSSERWKLGQLRPGDTVSFVASVQDLPTQSPPTRERHDPPNQKLSVKAAPALHTPPAPLGPATPLSPPIRVGDNTVLNHRTQEDGVLARRPAAGAAPEVTYRRSGDDNVLVEYGPIVLDLSLRARVHALHQLLAEQKIAGVIDLTPGIRSLQIHVDPAVLPVTRLLGLLAEAEAALPAASELVVPSRRVRLPLSWDDPATRLAIERYMAGVRDDAPWCPWNIEFIRRINGLEAPEDVYRTVFDAEYLVLGLGDVYLGAPVATPLDPRHRLVTTKYNPARTWTAENSVGIGGAYLCIYGMEGPGGYQFVGRTTQVWRTYPEPGQNPWLLDFFDRISWYPVSAEELLDLRADLAAGRISPDITEGSFSLAEHEAFLTENADSIAAFRQVQATAFEAERQAWEAAGEFDRAEQAAAEVVLTPAEVVVPEGGSRIDAPFVANVWKVLVEPGDVVEAGQEVVVLEAMKMEAAVSAASGGVVAEVLAVSGAQVAPGDALVVLRPQG